MDQINSGYTKLLVWHKAIALVTDVYRVTDQFPRSEAFGLTSQIRRAAVSIPSNIAEGSSRSTDKDFRHFNCIALGSCSELHTQLIISENLGYLSSAETDKLYKLLQEVVKMLNGLIKKLDK